MMWQPGHVAKKYVPSLLTTYITYPCNLFVPPSKRRPAVTIALTPLARSLLARLTTTTPTKQYQSWIKHNYPFTGKSCRRSFASAQNFMGILPSRIGTVSDTKTVKQHSSTTYFHIRACLTHLCHLTSMISS